MKRLVVGPAWVGDMVMAQCLFRLLRGLDPDGELHVVAPPATLPLLARMPEVTRGWRLDAAHGQLAMAPRRALARELAPLAFDQALVLANSLKSALLPWLARIPRRTGWRGEFRYGLLNDLRREDWQRYPLMVERFMALGLPSGADLPQQPPLPRLVADADNSLQLQASLGLSPELPVLALCPGAEFGPAKRWPLRHVASVAADRLAAGWQVWLLGGPGDREASAEVLARVAVITGSATGTGASEHLHDLAGRTRLVDAVDLLARADQVVCNDSGLMHIAAALGRPLVAVYGSTSPGFTPPLGADLDPDTGVSVQRLGLDCSPCFQRSCPLGHLNCLEQLGPDRVLAALADLPVPTTVMGGR